MWTELRPRRPYERKKVSKGGALIFGVGLGALLASAAILAGIIIPNIYTRLDNISYRVRSTYRQLMPHPEYLPTPAPTVSTNVASPGQGRPVELNLPPVIPDEDSPPAALSPAELSTVGDSIVVETQPEENTNAAPAETPPVPINDRVLLRGFDHQWQTWNNCGPATVSMYMGYFGRTETQVQAAQALKPNRDDKNVSPHELAAFARTSGLEATVRQGGTVEKIKRFLSNGIPVMAETWLVHDGDGLGHYRLVTGYDDVTGEFITFDSLNGPEHRVGYEQFEADWRVFNRLYIVVYPAAQLNTVKSIIGDDVDKAVMYEKLLAQAQRELERNPDDAIAYFNRGEVLTRLGRPQEAVAAFDRARQLGLHWRRLWYQFTPFEAYYTVGRYQDVLDLTEATLEGTGGLEEAYYYHGLALYATGQPGAEEDFQAALEYNPLFTPAAEALNLILKDR